MKLNKYIKDEHIITANAKAYEVCYKNEGYLPYSEYEAPPKAKKRKNKVEESLNDE